MLPAGALFLFLAAWQGGAAAGPAADDPAETRPMIRYQVSLPQHQAHRLAVRMQVDGVQGELLDLSMPVWTPGSYLVREFSRHVLLLEATDGAGRPLAVEKTSKNTWRVRTAGASQVVAAYELYANERSVRTSHVDADHAFLSPAGTFLYARGRTAEPHAVSVDAPDGWEVFSGLPGSGSERVARDYDELVDGPLEVGPHEVLSFEHEGVPHHLVLAGPGVLDGPALVQDVAKVVAEVADVFGQMPFDEYTFILHLVDSGGGGLEHRNSSVNMTSRWKLATEKGRRGLLGLLAHEYFHAWNVKRFRPEPLGPFDYDREVYTPDLWVAEGITSYVDDLALARAGFVDDIGDYLKARAKALRDLAERPGARRMSLSRASADAWIKHYRPDENSPNSSVSYYSKGALVALLLDLRLRRLTGGEVALRNVLRLGWNRYAAQDVGFPEGALAELSSEAAGTDLSAFFAAYVDGTAALQPDEDLAWVGLRLAVEPAKTKRPLEQDQDDFPLEPFLGIETTDAGGLCRVKTVLEDGPCHGAGLNTGDLLLAVDDMRVTASSLTDRLDRTAGAPVRLTFYRGQALRTLEVRPTLRRLEEWKLVPVDEPSDQQRAAFHAWTAWDLPEDSADDEAEDDEEGEP